MNHLVLQDMNGQSSCSRLVLVRSSLDDGQIGDDVAVGENVLNVTFLLEWEKIVEDFEGGVDRTWVRTFVADTGDDALSPPGDFVHEWGNEGLKK